ncbi:armadillo-type protein [Radiomyces spectabilis]|uniref:armadillo-type protein n=1 Tax=Radiomyces spectabilis TaxID=64574 RepID=UPI00221E4F2F|nr:armadillo-type protein [Radiomyces spectabilis]KAI8379291.1 armadillo-type protein [Radiomyces spectabilis]
MNFAWVSDLSSTRKRPSYTSKLSVPASTSPELRNQDALGINHGFSVNTSPLRRSRADTMPSQSSAFPYAQDGYANLAVSQLQQSRHRSGSVTLPAADRDADNELPQYDVSSPIDENTLASTLASLGLDDDHIPAASAIHPYPTSRNRSYTVTGRNFVDPPDVGLMPPSLHFNPFPPQTRQSLSRPRAVSVGVADVAKHPSPFASYLQEQGSPHLQPSLSSSAVASQPLRSSRSSSNLAELTNDFLSQWSFQSMGTKEPLADVPELDGKLGNTPSLGSPSSTSAQIPSRALWLGNINASLSVPDLLKIFSVYGHVESARILSDKECAFVNFASVESAVAAKTDLETRLGSRLAGSPVRVGYGKADVNLAIALSNESGPNAQGPTRALWVGNIPANTSPATLRSIFQPFGTIESVRVLSHKNCGFVNYEHQEDAVLARKVLQNKEILAPGTGAVRIGFAKVPSTPVEEVEEPNPPQQPIPSNIPETYQATQWATAMMMTSMMMNASGKQQTTQPSLYTAIAAEREFIMQQLGYQRANHEQSERIPLSYCSVIPPVPELTSDRKLEPLRLREMRRRLENGDTTQEVETIAHECMDEIVELCSDYIGNTVVQKLFELCSDTTKQHMLEKIAPYLAMIGVHKNGTWAAQKIIDFANTEAQIQLIRKHVAPYVPLLLLDQFGNYVVQCCLRMGAKYNMYIFDAIVDKCWEIGQGRFGARAVRAILENSIVTKEQQLYVAAAIVQNAILLTTNVNGTLLLIWLLDTSELQGRYRVLCPRFLPYLGKLCTHKLGSITVYKIINQTQEPDASNLLTKALFGEPGILDEVLRDQTHGVNLVQKILGVSHLDRRQEIVQEVKASLQRLKVHNVQGYKKLMDELEIPVKSSTDTASNTNDMTWMENPQAVVMMANMYAAAMTAAAATIQQGNRSSSDDPSTLPIMENMPPFDQLLKALLNTNTTPKPNQDNDKT